MLASVLSRCMNKSRNRLTFIAVNIARLCLALTFIVSGCVKAIDPLGTLYKLKDYAVAMGCQQWTPDWLLLVAAVGLVALEFGMGVLMLFAIRRRLVSA